MFIFRKLDTYDPVEVAKQIRKNEFNFADFYGKIF